MLPAVAAGRLATSCDVFCEQGVFDVGQSRRILKRARELGLAVKLHADEITPCGGAELAAEIGALSADHLVHVSKAGMERMLQAGVVPILLPATSFVLRLARDAPARAMADLGLPIALATDFNPGSSPTRSMPLVMTFACVRYGLTAAEALTAATVNAAHAIGVGGRFGALKTGMSADLVAFDLPSLRHLPYRFGENFVAVVVKGGEIVVDRRR
jgi:imidazolonepropionase